MKPSRISSDFYQLLPSGLKSQLEVFNLADNKFWLGSHAISFPRYGQSRIWDFGLDTDYVSCPNLSHCHSDSFADISNARAIDIKKILQKQNQPLAVFWSGGIDSTVVLSSVIKNFDQADLKNVIVFANDQSYFENPIFFHRVIEQYGLTTVNFKNLSNKTIQSLFDTCLVTDGEPADKLWIANIAIQFESIYGQRLLDTPYQAAADKFIEFLSCYMSPAQAQTYYQYLICNIQEANVDIVTMGDLFWWINFNFHWIEHLLIWYAQFPVKTPDAYAQYKKNYRPWYNTDAYQLWSLMDRPKSLVPDQHHLYKMPAKQYIHDLVKDPFYLNYKSKLGSSKSLEKAPSDMIILADGSVLDHSDSHTLEKFISQYCLVR